MIEGLPKIPDILDNSEHIPFFTLGRALRYASVWAMKHLASDNMIRLGISPNQEVKSLLADLRSQANPESIEWQIFLDHLFPIGNRLHTMASRNHTDVWLRDEEYSFDFINNLNYQDHTLKIFEKRQRGSGQMPTAVGILGQTPWHFTDDETNLLYIISAAHLIQQDKTFLTNERRKCLEESLGFVNKHVQEGMYVTPAGERRGWIDAFEFPKSDVISQNQGLYALALLALDNIGFKIPASDIQAAINIYQKLAGDGYLPFSARFPEAIGPGSLQPDFHAITRYNQSLLTPRMVANTLENIPRSKHGLKVLSTSPKGGYFDPRYFKATYQGGQEGNYQNGGVWLYWEDIAFEDAQLHGVLSMEDRNYRDMVEYKLIKTDYSEFIQLEASMKIY